MTGLSSSLFNVREAVQAPYFTLEEVKDLYGINEEQKDLTRSRIVEEVFTQTAGYFFFFVHIQPCGLASRCGKTIDEVLLKDRIIRYATF